MNFEKLTNILVAVAAIAVTTGVAYDRLSAKGQAPVDRQARAREVIGKPLPVEGLLGKTPEPTLVLALSTECHFCNESAPFYQRLSKLKGAGGGGFRLVAVLPQDSAAASAYLGGHNISPDAIFSKPLNMLMVQGTPTVFLLDAAGKVRNVWLGHLTEKREGEVLSSIRELCPQCISNGS